jgi:hypothetical protein
MRLDHVAELAAGRLLGRVVRRTIAATVCALFILIAFYHFTVAGTFALEARYGALDARLAIGGIYAVAALITGGVLLVTRNRPFNGKQIAQGRELQVIALLEAVMLGYALARRRD